MARSPERTPWSHGDRRGAAAVSACPGTALRAGSCTHSRGRFCELGTPCQGAGRWQVFTGFMILFVFPVCNAHLKMMIITTMTTKPSRRQPKNKKDTTGDGNNGEMRCSVRVLPGWRLRTALVVRVRDSTLCEPRPEQAFHSAGG